MKKYMSPKIEFFKIIDVILTSLPNIDGGTIPFNALPSNEEDIPNVDGKKTGFIW